jgi:hypothetical protein
LIVLSSGPAASRKARRWSKEIPPGVGCPRLSGRPTAEVDLPGGIVYCSGTTAVTRNRRWVGLAESVKDVSPPTRLLMSWHEQETLTPTAGRDDRYGRDVLSAASQRRSREVRDTQVRGNKWLESSGLDCGADVGETLFQ